MKMNFSGFPFCAVLGQDDMKNALIWNAVNPRIGGVLLCGEKGTAKSTVVRGLAEVLPDCSVVELPLNITEDRLVGSIDIEAAISEGVRKFEPGLLKKADGNFLYVDEVNLLSDHIVSALLETAASGVNHVEREGISYSHPSRFCLIGSMNPEEGKLRPQFLDRFGLYVTVESSKDVQERAEIIRRELEYEKDPEKFRGSFGEEQEELKEHLQKARKNLARVVVTEAAMKLAAAISAEANCAGHRAELVITETARAIAAWEGRTVLNQEDIRKAAEFALPHRMRELEEQPVENESREQPDQPENNEPEKDGPEDQAPEDHTPEQTSPENTAPEENSLENASQETTQSPESDQQPPEEPDTSESQPEKDSPEKDDQPLPEEVQQIGKTFQVNPWLKDSEVHRAEKGSGKRSLIRTSGSQGRYVKAVQPRGEFQELALDATLRAAAPFQRSRAHNGMAFAIRKEDIRTKIREKRAGNTILFVVDASGSMGADKRMGAVKGAICSLLNDAYQKRDRVGMIAFRKRKAELLLDVTRSVDLAKKELEILPTGGRTPLSAGLSLARQVIQSQKQKDKDCLPVIVLLSDGRANAALGEENPVKEALQEAALIRQEGIKSIVIDTENGFIRLKLAVDLARELKADYFKLEDLNAETLAGVVSETVKFS